MTLTMNHSSRRHFGFTLIEIMITVAIVGILAAIAFPAFTNQMRKSARAAAQAQMMDLANKQQFYLASQRAYYAGSGPTFAALNVTLPDDVTKWYTVVITADNAATPPTFLITATPVAGTRQVADGALTLDNTGAKTPTTKW
jgi:type IV pilus assembly protein PilE